MTGPLKKLTLTLFFLSVLTALSISASAQKSRKDRQGKTGKEPTETEQIALERHFTDGSRFFILDEYDQALSFYLKAFEIDPKDAAINYKVAETYLRMDQPIKAEAYAERALEKNPDNRYYYLLLAQIHEQRQDLDKAVNVLSEMIKKVRGSEDYYYEVARLYIFMNKPKDAITAFDNLEKIYGVNPETSARKQKIYLVLNQLDKAVAETQKLIDAYPDEMNYRLSLAELYISNNLSKKAVPILEQVIAENAHPSSANLMLSDVYRQNGEQAKAISQLEAAFSDPGLSADAKVKILVSLNSFQSEPGYQEAALRLGTEAVEAHPRDARVQAVYADLLTIMGRKKEARQHYLIAAEADNSLFKVWQQVIFIDYELREYDSLSKHADAALEVFPQQATLWYFKGIAANFQKNYKQSIEALEEASLLSSDPAMLLEINSLMGDSYNGLQEYAKSDEAYERVLKADPNNAPTLNNYSYYLSLRKEKLAKAKEMGAKLTAAHPNNPTYLDTYGWVLYVGGDYKKALPLLERAAKDSDSGTILEHYGDVLYQLGKSQEALVQWKKAKQAGDTTDLIDKKIQDGKLYE